MNLLRAQLPHAKFRLIARTPCFVADNLRYASLYALVFSVLIGRDFLLFWLNKVSPFLRGFCRRRAVKVVLRDKNRQLVRVNGKYLVYFYSAFNVMVYYGYMFII